MILSFTPGTAVTASSNPQTSTPLAKAQALLAQMTPEERVGQLFLVTYKGRDVSSKSQVFDLISNWHVGGVVLRSTSDNFIGPVGTGEEAYKMIAELQSSKWHASLPLAVGTATPVATRSPALQRYIPLFVAISQEGDRYPFDQIINDLTPLPHQMAIGATWKTDLAQRVGAVQGKELQTLGINMYLGPSLDVLDVSKPEGFQELGARTFGGDPFWVGEMGRAYIKGLHQGSENHLAVIAKHFPGRGGSDRPPDEEVATVRKSLEQLKQIELAPFFAVTGNSNSAEATTDGLLVSHIRYQGLQGNIRATTRPISFDQTALDLVLNLPAFAAWRQKGGVIVSDDLGSSAVRMFNDPTGKTFDAGQVARNAFLAGNDLLYVNNFLAPGDTDEYTTIIRTLDLFTKKYREDATFAQRVNLSVERLLTLKFKLYAEFRPESVISPFYNNSQIGSNRNITLDVAQQSATLISPEASELRSTLPRPPDPRDNIVIITETLSARQCSKCPEQAILPVDAIQNAVIKLYGPRAGGQIAGYKIQSFSFLDLNRLLNKTATSVSPEIQNMENTLLRADWIIFAHLNVNRNRPESLALKRFLSERPDLGRNKRVIAFALNAPYYLDATDISKLTAYYGIYGKTSAFVDVAVRILFQELTPSGASPVSIPGIAYDLIVATAPNSSQVIPLFVDTPENNQPGATSTRVVSLTPSPTPVLSSKMGDTIPVRTGPIYDKNKNPVPDGTVVRFTFTTGGKDVGISQTMETVSNQGIGRVVYRVQNSGQLEIRVSSDPAVNSSVLRFNIPAGAAAAITVIAPTQPVQSTLPPTQTQTATVTPVRTGTPLASGSAPRIGDWMIAMLVVFTGSAGFGWLGSQRFSTRWGVRWGLLAAVGGLLSYLYLAVGLPGSTSFLQRNGTLGILGVTILGILLGWAGAWIWLTVQTRREKSLHQLPPSL